MLLVVDVGNTQTHLGLMDGSEIVHEWRLSTERRRTADELAALLQGLFSLRGESLRGAIDDVGIASVVPSLTQLWVEMCCTHLNLDAFVVGPGVRTGMRIAMKSPIEVGADRVVNAVAAYEQYGGPCIVADFGTATTVDVVSAEGDYLGGAISPGIELSLDALTSSAAKLAKVELVEPPAPSASPPPRPSRSAPCTGSLAPLRASSGPSGASSVRRPSSSVPVASPR